MVDAGEDITAIDAMSAASGMKFCIVVSLQSVETKLAKNSSEYLSAIAGDRTGSFTCKIFGGSPVYNFFKAVQPGTIVLMEGIARDYRGVFSPDIMSVRALTESEILRGNYAQKVTACSHESVESLKIELNDMISHIGDATLRAVVAGVVNELGDDFHTRAAGISMHHAYRNGLLEHTVHAARVGILLLRLYPFVDHDIALAGLLLHDVGKTIEYTGDAVTQRTKLGVLHGHLILGYRLLRKIAIQNRMNGDILERLEHVLLSHHNEPEFGAVVRPATPEAVFVALVDNLDAKMGMVEQLLKSTPAKNVFSDFHKGLESKLLVLPVDRDGEMCDGSQ
ncbi:MAG: HD domain-containing protein [Puniceicoccales bacterium]|jgi:3'-5' exoribonuclease|nr:HD domain-containing protein [Puniceicoccales bacterium]